MYRRVNALILLSFILGLALASVSDAALVGWWKFNDGSGTIAKDSSGRGYHGTVINPVWVEGRYGGALSFSGTSYVDVPPASWSTIRTQATVCFWAYGDPARQPQANFIFGAFSDPANNEARRMSAHVPWSDGTIYFDTGGPGYNRINKAGNAADYRGTWTFWTFLKNADTGDQQIYINGVLWHSGTNMRNTMEGVTKFTIGTKPSLAEGWYYGMIDDFRLYDTALSVDEIQKAMTGRGPGLGLASDPVAANETTDIPRDAMLNWTPGQYPSTHDVYVGTTFADVNSASRTNAKGVLASQGQADTTFDPPGSLVYGQTYYWRIDEVNKSADGTIYKGEVWSFTAEPYGYPIPGAAITATASSSAAAMGPENTINGSGLDKSDLHGTDGTTMWMSGSVQPNWIQYQFDKVYKLNDLKVWNSNQLIESFLGFGAKKVTIEYSSDGTTWTALANVPEFARATGLAGYAANTTVSFGGVMAKYVKLTINSNWGGMAPQMGLSEVRFSYVPVQARVPQPATAAKGVSIDGSLDWRPGREAASHKVFFGTDANAVTKGTAAAKTVADHGYAPGSLNLGTTYYWRVDEVNTVTYPGDVWSFTTQDYKVVDDFESYTDKAGAEVFTAWVDGFADNYKSSGSTVGKDMAQGGTFGETTIIHGGRQSMPLRYDNAKAPNFSEAVRTFDTPQNWTTNGIKSLSLWFQGVAGNGGQLYVKINGTKVPYDGAAGNLAKSLWIPWNIDLSKVAGNLSKVTSLTIGIEGAGAKGTLYVDDIGLYPKTPEYYTPADPGKANLKALYPFEGNVNDTSGNGLNGTLKLGTLVASGRTDGGSALKVDKAGYVDLGNPPSLDFGTGDWTVTAWFKTAMKGTGDANQGTIYAKGGDSTAGKRMALIMTQNTEGVLTLVVDDDITRYDANSKTLTNDDQWHFVAGQREGRTIRIFLDGQLEGTTTLPAGYTLAGTSQRNAYIGASTYQPDGHLYKFFGGLIDDVRLYNRALSVGEILWLAGQSTPAAKPF